MNVQCAGFEQNMFFKFVYILYVRRKCEKQGGHLDTRNPPEGYRSISRHPDTLVFKDHCDVRRKQANTCENRKNAKSSRRWASWKPQGSPGEAARETQWSQMGAPEDPWGHLKGIQEDGHAEDLFFGFGTLFSIRFMEGGWLWLDRSHPKKETDLLGRTTFYRLEG